MDEIKCLDNKPLLLTYLALFIIIIAGIYSTCVLLKPDFEIEHSGLIIATIQTKDDTIISFHDGFTMKLKGNHGILLGRYTTIKQGRNMFTYYEVVGNDINLKFSRSYMHQ